MMPYLEIACFDAISIQRAITAGADRVEYCADYVAGGVTPSIHGLQQVPLEGATPMNVMIRPRAGNFLYSESEFEQMKTEIELFKSLSLASGFVFGILDGRDRVDVHRNQELVELAKPLPCTFHRAFDQTSDLAEATGLIIGCGFKSILSSGGQPNAMAGVDVVAKLQEQFRGQIAFILGGGVRSTNVGELKLRDAIQWYHSAAIIGQGQEVDENEARLLLRRLKDAE